MRSLAIPGAMLVLCALVAGAAPQQAGATIVSASVLDGPDASILNVEGAAMAPDGSGGVVYRKLVEGTTHIFVARFANGHWDAPIQVDSGQIGPAESPRIAAADGGELLVVWVQPWMWISSSPGAQASLHYELMSAVLQPGAESFGQIERVDDVGDGTAAYPSLAMAPNGSAYVAYRVVVNPLAPYTPLPLQPMRPGDELVEVRVARFNGLSWSAVGVINRLPGQVTMRRPTAANAPAVAVNDAGQALVVWQEPGIEGVARIWARRLFGTTKGNVLAVSPSTIGGAPVTVDADAPTVAINENGVAEVAMRLEGGQGSPLGSAHILLNTLPMPLVEEVSSFTGPVPLAGANGISEPSLALDKNGDYHVAYTVGGAAQLVSGKEGASGAPSVLGAGFGPALATVDPEGGGSTAWLSSNPLGQPAVEVRQNFPDGAWQTGYLTAPLSGAITGLVTAGSGLGDELVAFRQGSSTDSQVVASVAQSPPEQFHVHTPSGWVKASAATVEWQAAVQGVGSVTYSVLVDGRVLVHGLSGLSARLDSRELGDGVRHIQVLATDDLGQETMSPAVELRVETSPPLVSVRRLSHGRVEVRVYGDAAGVKAADTLIDFGDGATIRRRDTVIHSYRRSGHYTITIHATDKVGNYRDAHVRVQIR